MYGLGDSDRRTALPITRSHTTLRERKHKYVIDLGMRRATPTATDNRNRKTIFEGNKPQFRECVQTNDTYYVFELRNKGGVTYPWISLRADCLELL